MSLLSIVTDEVSTHKDFQFNDKSYICASTIRLTTGILYRMKKSDIPRLPQYFDKYIALTDDDDIVNVLESLLEEINNTDIDALEAIGDKVYQSHKWTVKDILQHVIDTERVMQYRALRFSRRDITPLPGFDDNTFARVSEAHRRSIEDLLDELAAVRDSSIAQFSSFPDEMMIQSGIANNITISVLAIGFSIAGHQIHHFNIIREKYLPLVGA